VWPVYLHLFEPLVPSNYHQCKKPAAAGGMPQETNMVESISCWPNVHSLLPHADPELPRDNFVCNKTMQTATAGETPTCIAVPRRQHMRPP
jgi:hypothetical protein